MMQRRMRYSRSQANGNRSHDGQEHDRTQNIPRPTCFPQPTTIQSQGLLGISRFHGRKKETAHKAQFTALGREPASL